MFEESLVESTSMLKTRKRGPVLFSVTAQIAVLSALVIIPLLHPEIIPIHALKLSSIEAPPLPKTPPPPQIVHVQPAMTSSTAQVANINTAPPRLRTLLTATEPPTGVPVDGPPVLIAIGGGPTGSPFGSTLPGPAGPAVSVTPTKPAGPIGPARISKGVAAGLLLAPIQPVYPQMAKIARVEGIVTIHAIISKKGLIERAEVVSGSPMLAQAALDAVKAARYRPYLLNDDPTEVDTTITVNFKLNN